MSIPINFSIGEMQFSGELLVIFHTIDLRLTTLAVEKALVNINPVLTDASESENNIIESNSLLLITDTGYFNFVPLESTIELFATSIDSVDAMRGVVDLLKNSSDFKEIQESRNVDTKSQSNHEPYQGGDDFEIDNTTWFTGF